MGTTELRGSADGPAPLEVPGEQAGDTELLSVIRSQPRDSPQHEAACAVLVDRYRWLVASCVRRYRGTPETEEDLTQVGYVGLLKAINQYDPAMGNGLAAYAWPSVSGEIKRHFRDKRWNLHVTRPLQELRLEMLTATADLTQHLQRAPSDAEVARFIGVSHEDLADARGADMAFHPLSLDAPVTGDGGGSRELADLLGAADTRLDQVVDMEAVATYWPRMPAVQQRILLLRFYGNMTQTEIGEQLGVSQMQVSRLQTRALRYLRTAILDAGQNNRRLSE
jgi:RNA polymerase sigma-B factor